MQKFSNCVAYLQNILGSSLLRRLHTRNGIFHPESDQYDFSIYNNHLFFHVENIVIFYFQFRLSSMKSNYMRFDSSSTQTLD